MMHVQSSGEALVDDAAIRLAFDPSGSGAGYLIISRPEDGSREGFFGSDHYVEVKDQLFGRYGGLESLAVVNDRAVVVCLSSAVPGVGREISITTAHPMPEEVLTHLRRLERS